MTTALVASNVLLWIAVIALGLTVLALTRQIGVLLERVAPAGALSLGAGPAAGEPAPEVRVRALDGTLHRIGAPRPDGRALLLLFTSPVCPVCDAVLPAARALARDEAREIELLVASDGDDDHRTFARDKGIDPGRYLVSRELGLRYAVGRLPHAVLIDAGGVLRASGLVNSREHLESLLEAHALGVATVQDLLRESDDAALRAVR